MGGSLDNAAVVAELIGHGAGFNPPLGLICLLGLVTVWRLDTHQETDSLARNILSNSPAVGCQNYPGPRLVAIRIARVAETGPKRSQLRLDSVSAAVCLGTEAQLSLAIQPHKDASLDLAPCLRLTGCFVTSPSVKRGSASASPSMA